MDEILGCNNLVYSIVSKYQNSLVDKEDLYQAGMLGLITAYQNFDPKYGVKFSTYAYNYILGEVTKYIRENKLIHVSRDILSLHKKVLKTKEVMSQKLGREASDEEVALYLEIDLEKLQEIEEATKDVESLDYVADEEKENLYNKVSVEEKDYSPSILDLKEELYKLSTEERGLILARYFEELTQTETSKRLGMSQVQVSRQEAKILHKLKSRL